MLEHTLEYITNSIFLQEGVVRLLLIVAANAEQGDTVSAKHTGRKLPLSPGICHGRSSEKILNWSSLLLTHHWIHPRDRRGRHWLQR